MLVALPHTLAAQTAERDGPAPDDVKPPADRSLGLFQGFNPASVGRLVVTPSVPVSAVEQYRKLAAALHHAQIEKGIKVVMVTSAAPGEGKTLTTTNLALTLSGSYHRNVLLIDGDLRRPAVHQVFQLPNVVGLNDGLKSETEQKLSLIQISEHLTVLPAGRPDSDPMSGLTSDRMRRVIREAAARFDWVLVDTPPVGFLSDANLLAGMVDGAIFVVRAGKSPYRLIQRALDAVGRNRIIGVVLNAVKQSDDVVGYGYYGYYGEPAEQNGPPDKQRTKQRNKQRT
jgi:capsular exopolysaccharide synthesis family protein